MTYDCDRLGRDSRTPEQSEHTSSESTDLILSTMSYSSVVLSLICGDQVYRRSLSRIRSVVSINFQDIFRFEKEMFKSDRFIADILESLIHRSYQLFPSRDSRDEIHELIENHRRVHEHTSL